MQELVADPVVEPHPARDLLDVAANAFLATKITFINELADLCDKVGADVHEIARGIGLDGRIGPKFLHPGPGYGGSCFPKDTMALVRTAQDAGAPVRLIESVVEVNQQRKKGMASRIVRACGGSVSGKTVAVLGVTFKPNTDDMRESPALDILPALMADGAAVRAYDPKGMDEARTLIPGVDWCDGPYEAMDGADALTILTEWNEFRLLDLPRVRQLLRSPVMIDLRNIYNPEEMAAAGFFYTSLGRPRRVALEEASLEA